MMGDEELHLIGFAGKSNPLPVYSTFLFLFWAFTGYNNIIAVKCCFFHMAIFTNF